jgi:precorrin-3B methylase
MNTLIKVSPVMDAASSTGAQLGITLNSDTIKITGYNNF